MTDQSSQEAAYDYFGSVLMKFARDRAIRKFDRDAAGWGSAPADQPFLKAFSSLPREHLALAREACIDAIDEGLHDLLAQLVWEYGSGRIRVTVDGQDLIELSDEVSESLPHDLLGEDGWLSRLSEYGAPPSDARLGGA
ncbi:MAG: hypothetical protein ACYTGX_11510 [Planctomycetota bacterium]|jgi:hypothetical protein